MCKDLIFKNRMVEILELNNENFINTNPLYYYGTSINPLLFSNIFSAIEFLELLKEKFGWQEYTLEYAETIRNNDLVRAKITKSIDIDIRTIYLFIKHDHTYDLPIVPQFLYEIKKDA